MSVIEAKVVGVGLVNEHALLALLIWLIVLLIFILVIIIGMCCLKPVKPLVRKTFVTRTVEYIQPR